MQHHSIDIGEAVREAVEESIENMAFMVVESDLEDAQASAGDPVIALLEVIKPSPGSMSLSMPLTTAVAIARCLHGIQQAEISQIVLEDMACELLNTIAGRFMKRVLPAECMFCLGLPGIGKTIQQDTAQRGVRGEFLADGHFLAVEVIL